MPIARLRRNPLSGGLDSTTVLAYAKGQVDDMSALTFHYGQTRSKEVD